MVTPQLVVLQKSSSPAVVLEFDVLGLGEMRAQEMRGAGLQRLAVLHHRLDGIGVHGAGEALILRLLAGDHRHGQHVSAKSR